MCHHRHTPRPTAAAPERDPRVRASDAERESTATLLRDHGAAGRLDVEELETRLAGAYAATTRGDLSTLLADLPGPRAVRGRAQVAPDRAGHEWLVLLWVALLLVAIWSVTGAGHFWPAWAIGPWALALALEPAGRVARTG